jgi:hypothetical protein
MLPVVQRTLLKASGAFLYAGGQKDRFLLLDVTNSFSYYNETAGRCFWISPCLVLSGGSWSSETEYIEGARVVGNILVDDSLDANLQEWLQHKTDIFASTISYNSGCGFVQTPVTKMKTADTWEFPTMSAHVKGILYRNVEIG